MGNYGKPTNSPFPSDRLKGGEFAMDSAAKAAHKQVYGNPKVSDQTAKRAINIEQGMAVKKAWARYPAHPQQLAPKYHQ